MQNSQRACRVAAALSVQLAIAASMLITSMANASATPTPRNGASQMAANASSPDLPLLDLIPDSPITPGDPAYNEVRHKCVVVGQASTAEAVHCADVFTQNAAVGGVDVWVENEVYCQRIAPPNVGSIIACSGIKEQLAAGSPLGTVSIPQQICGEILGHSPCSSGRDLHAGFTFNYLPGGSPPHFECSIWGESVRDSIILPVTGHPTVSAVVVATDHFNVISGTSREGYCQSFA